MLIQRRRKRSKSIRRVQAGNTVMYPSHCAPRSRGFIRYSAVGSCGIMSHHGCYWSTCLTQPASLIVNYNMSYSRFSSTLAAGKVVGLNEIVRGIQPCKRRGHEERDVRIGYQSHLKSMREVSLSQRRIERLWQNDVYSFQLRVRR